MNCPGWDSTADVTPLTGMTYPNFVFKTKGGKGDARDPKNPTLQGSTSIFRSTSSSHWE